MAPSVAEFNAWAILAGLALGIVSIIINRILARKRKEALQRLAADLGLAFLEDAHWWIDHYKFLEVFKPGHSKRIRVALHGTMRAHDVRFCDYQYTIGSGKNRQVHHAGIVIIHLAAPFPNVTIVPENLGHKVFDALGGDDIDFESEEFSRKFWVRSIDRKFAYDLLHPRMMEFLMTPGWDRWQINNGVICMTRLRAPKPDEIRPALERAIAAADLIPPRMLARTA